MPATGTSENNVWLRMMRMCFWSSGFPDWQYESRKHLAWSKGEPEMGRRDAFKNPFRNEREKMSISATKEFFFWTLKIMPVHC